ncbi:hypothetical protein VitviT2T_013006 [Vitis vinifera]|uniref:Protein phosphatase n=3 Tax=Vitis vinifera TaxID=29760 RepID=A0ABY9CHG9_VITVI|nr:hypothetical protein VitviT2T_013006 [Vitis vinifera]
MTERRACGVIGLPPTSLTRGIPKKTLFSPATLNPRSPRSMRMISGSKFISSKDGKNPKTKKDVHVKIGQTFVIAHGSCQFVRDLADNCSHIANKIKGLINPIDLLNHAYLETKVPGSSTACIITLNEWCLHAVNIGDNGFILLRNEEILYESPVQQHTYKTPYQLGNANDSLEEIKLTELEPGDIIIAGSAGLFNNLFTHEIKDLVIKEIRKDPAPSPDMIAAEIAKNAIERSIDKYRFTPYSKAAWQAGKRHKGGKMGDVTAIFAFILP